MHEPLFDEPFVGRFEKVLLELLLERGEAAVAHLGQFVDRDVVEYVLVDRLLEVLLHLVDVAEHLALEAAVVLCEDQVHQFGHFERFGRFVLGEQVVLDVLVDRREEVADGAPRRIDHVALFAAVLAAVVVGDVELVVHAQLGEDAAQLFGRIVEGDLFERLSVFRDVFGVVMAGAQVEEVAAVHFVADVAVVDVLFAAQYVADGVAGEVVGLDAVAVGLYILHDHRLLGRSRKTVGHNVGFLIVNNNRE